MKNFKQITFPYLIIPILVILFHQCEIVEEFPEVGNPIDPNDSSFVPVETYIHSGPGENETIDGHTVTFVWGGNQYVVEYSTQLDGNGWSWWSIDTSKEYSFLDEGLHTFEVKARYHTEAVDETPASRNFNVDAVAGPGLMFSPRQINVTKDSSFTVNVNLEEVENLMAVGAFIEYDSLILKFDGYTVLEGELDLLTSNGGDPSYIIDQDSENSIIKIDLIVVGGEPAGISGSGSIVQLRFTALQSGLSLLKYQSNSVFVDRDLQDISLLTLVDVAVEVSP